MKANGQVKKREKATQKPLGIPKGKGQRHISYSSRGNPQMSDSNEKAIVETRSHPMRDSWWRMAQSA